MGVRKETSSLAGIRASRHYELLTGPSNCPAHRGELRYHEQELRSEERSVITALNIAQILLAIALIAIILLQAGSSQLGGVFGLGDVGVPRKRRGLERTVFNLTIFLAVLFLALAVANVIVTGTPVG